MYQYQFPDLKEASQHGSSSFPCAFYQLQATGHGVLVKHHWHEEIEMLYFPEGERACAALDGIGAAFFQLEQSLLDFINVHGFIPPSPIASANRRLLQLL